MPARRQGPATLRPVGLTCEQLELREMPAVTSALAGGILTVTDPASGDRIRIYADGADLVVLDGTAVAGRFASAAVTAITVTATGGNDTVIVAGAVTQPVSLTGGGANNKLVAGSGPTVLTGGPGNDALFGGLGPDTFNGGGGRNALYKVKPADVVFPNPGDVVLAEADPAGTGGPQATLTAADVTALLARAAAASASTDAIIAITDRNGRILGVRVESGVDPAITGSTANLVFAVDGAVSLARTGAFFGNNQAPLTSRTVQFISQSTITQREVNSNPAITDPNSTVAGPGFVAPVGVGGHFPPGIALTPQVDLSQIEQTNRDASSIGGVALAGRFNIDPAFVPAGHTLFAPDSYGVVSGLMPGARNRGIATLPGGIPIVKNGEVVGGIGVFFPGKTGYATEENSALSQTYDPTKPDRSLEAEWMAFAAVGGNAAGGGPFPDPVGPLGGVALPAGISGLPSGRIDLVGITLPLVGPGNPQNGLQAIMAEAAAVGRGNPFEGTNIRVDTAGDTVLAGLPVPDGWLVTPHAGVGITQQQVEQIITQGINQANLTRAAIRLPAGSRGKFVYAVTDLQGNVVGLYRDPDATVFSIDVAVAKARNVAYYDNPAQLQPIDQIPGVPAGTALTARTFRYLGLPTFPEGIDGTPPGPFSILNDGGANPQNGLQVGAPLPASAFQSVVGYAAFHPDANFRDPFNPLNQNGIVFFPGSSPLYGLTSALIGGFGVSGDGVDQDDVVTVAGETGFGTPPTVLRADQVFVRGVRLPYQKFDRNPEG
ncbi:MAG: hypothetical protein JWO38_5903 [Gemmataceae bacterium]|nr:hypothetical protein [Gemmataceae bacterium]